LARSGEPVLIHLNDFRAEPEELVRVEVAAAERVIRSGWYILGEELTRFEKAFGVWARLPRLAGVGNGMDAIEIGLRASGIGAGDEVVSTPMTAFASTLAILRAGATPVMADIDPETALLDLASVERCLTRRTKAVLLVHLYGRLPDMDAWSALCARHRIALLEDCAQAHGASWEGKSAGTFGLFGAFSFYPTKNLGALGDGGAVCMSTPEGDAAARVLRNYGQSDRYRHDAVGLNSRLDEMQAALLTERIAWLDRFLARRREIASAYDRRITNPLVKPLAPARSLENHVYHLYVVRCEERDRLAAHLAGHGIQTLIHYPVPVHCQKPTQDLARDPAGLAATERHASTCLSIPCHPQMSDSDVAKVIDALNAFC
jgi:dTDP-4-amino-4,6-dideoxygalactose transaminase